MNSRTTTVAQVGCSRRWRRLAYFDDCGRAVSAQTPNWLTQWVQIIAVRARQRHRSVAAHGVQHVSAKVGRLSSSKIAGRRRLWRQRCRQADPDGHHPVHPMPCDGAGIQRCPMIPC
jgi:hypothetical protein